MLWVRHRYPLPPKGRGPESAQHRKPLALRVLGLAVIPLIAYAASFAYAVFAETSLGAGVFNVPQDPFSLESVVQSAAQYFACGTPCVVGLLFLSPLCEEVVFRRLVPQTIAQHQASGTTSKEAALKTQATWSAVFFGLYHIVQLLYSAGENPFLTLLQIVDAAVIGWYFFWVDYNVFGGSVAPSVFLHVVNNLFSALVSPNYKGLKTMAGVPLFCVALAIEVLGYAVFCHVFTELGNASENEQNKKSRKSKKKQN